MKNEIRKVSKIHFVSLLQVRDDHTVTAKFDCRRVQTLRVLEIDRQT